MATYYFNTNEDDKGMHEVHTESCSFLPKVENRIYIGLHPDCSGAISSAKARYPSYSFDGCYYCCNSCHTG